MLFIPISGSTFINFLILTLKWHEQTKIWNMFQATETYQTEEKTNTF